MIELLMYDWLIDFFIFSNIMIVGYFGVFKVLIFLMIDFMFVW